jgi:uncharacterized membrane protein YfcA
MVVRMRDQARRDEATVQIGAIVLTFGSIVGFGALLLWPALWLLSDVPRDWVETYIALSVSVGAAVALRNHFKSQHRSR